MLVVCAQETGNKPVHRVIVYCETVSNIEKDVYLSMHIAIIFSLPPEHSRLLVIVVDVQ